MTTKHTPTPAPWVTGIQGGIFKDGYGDIANCINSNAEANAAHIVRCVNERDTLVKTNNALVEALEAADFTLSQIEDQDDALVAATMKKTSAALALAKGE